jgi:glyoxylase-like metal-dependent hydrolase (beta-lactamase superfamily II)
MTNELDPRKETMMPIGKVNFEAPSPHGTNVASDSGSSAKQSFPPDGLVALSRIAYQNTPLAIEKIRRGVFVFRGAGGTVTAVAGSDGCAVIDTGYGPRVDEIKSSIKRALSETPDWLVNTHWHFDHTDGNQAFVADGARILAHTKCRVRLSHDQYVRSLEWSIPASPRIAWPTITIDGASAIDVGLETLQLLPQSAAHTDGDLAVFLSSSNVLVMGDLFTNGSYPVIDESSGGTLRGMIDALERLLPLVNADTVVVPGHGPVADRHALVRFHDMLQAIEERILSLIKAQLTLPEIIESSPTAEFDPTWEQGYVTGAHFIRMVLAGLDLTEASPTGQ